MFILRYVAQTLLSVINIYEILIIVRCVFSFFPVNENGPIVRFVYAVTEFLLAPVRSILDKTPIGPSHLMIDFSPFLAILILDFVSMSLYI